MCNIAAAAQFGMGAYDYFQQQEFAEAYNRNQDKQSAINRELSEKNALRSYEALAEREQEEARLASEEIADLKRQALAAQGTALASGATGLNVEALLQDFEAQALRGETTTRNNFLSVRRQLERNRETTRDQLYGALLRGQPRYMQEPNPLTAFMNIGMQTFSTYQQTSPGPE